MSFNNNSSKEEVDDELKPMIETERLYLRHIIFKDIDAMFLLYSDPDVMNIIGGQEVRISKEQVIEDIKKIREQYITNDCIGRLAVIKKDTNEFIGWTGLKNENNVNNHDKFIDLGYRLIKKYWNYGYATEACIACIKYGFNVKKFDKICAYVLENNQSSINVLQKCGFIKIETFISEDGNEIWFEIIRT